MAKNDKLTDAHRAFIHAAGFSAGIVPMEEPTHDMRRALSNLPEEDQRRLKRKFRKLWRKALKAKASGVAKNLEAQLGLGKKIPTKAQRNARKQLVATALHEEKVKPMLDAFHNASKKDKTVMVD